MGISRVARYTVVLHGYRILPEAGRLSVGSGDADQIQVRATPGNNALDAGILEISFQKDGDRSDFLLTQTDPRSQNVIRINGLPLRSLPLEPEKEHVITFGAFRHNTDASRVLRLGIRNGKPIFRYKNRKFTKDFTRKMMWGLISAPHREGTVRHLAVNGRIQFPGLGEHARDLLKQASILRYRGGYWLAANDADIRLNGLDFPNSADARSEDTISLATRELGSGGEAAAFKVTPPGDAADTTTVQLLGSHKKKIPLPNDDLPERLCLTSDESYFADTFDVKDPQFPKAGRIVSVRDGDFVFRGETLKTNGLYQCGAAVFSIDQADPVRLRSVIWYGLLFLAGAFFAQSAFSRGNTLIGVVLGSALFLLAFRQVLAFRAWQGFPFKQSVFMDSLIAPLLFVMIVMLVATRYQAFLALKFIAIKCWNYFRPGSHKIPPRIDSDSRGGHVILGLALFGFVIYFFFKDHLNYMFPAVIALCLLGSLAVSLLRRIEERILFMSTSDNAGERWKPLVILIPVFLLFLIAAPLFGGKEVIALLPGRPRPDIFIQLFLIFAAAYLAGLWVKESQYGVPNPVWVIITLLIPITIPFIQGVVAGDMGFFVMVCMPMLVLLVFATWHLDRRIRLVMTICMLFFPLSIMVLKSHRVSIDDYAMRRIAFFVDKERIKSEYFVDYLAHLPMLWSSDQGILGSGFFRGERYPELAETSVNDNVASVFIQGEFGAIGTMLTMAVFVLLAVAGILFVSDHLSPRGGFRPWFLFGICLSLIWTAGTMFLANFGYFPLTGKNLPFLGLDSLNDVVRYGLLIGFMVRYMDLPRIGRKTSTPKAPAAVGANPIARLVSLLQGAGGFKILGLGFVSLIAVAVFLASLNPLGGDQKNDLGRWASFFNTKEARQCIEIVRDNGKLQLRERPDMLNNAIENEKERGYIRTHLKRFNKRFQHSLFDPADVPKDYIFTLNGRGPDAELLVRDLSPYNAYPRRKKTNRFLGSVNMNATERMGPMLWNGQLGLSIKPGLSSTLTVSADQAGIYAAGQILVTDNKGAVKAVLGFADSSLTIRPEGSGIVWVDNDYRPSPANFDLEQGQIVEIDGRFFEVWSGKSPPLAFSVKREDKNKRVYPFGDRFPFVGPVSLRGTHHSLGMEYMFHEYLEGIPEKNVPPGEIWLTLEPALQSDLEANISNLVKSSRAPIPTASGLIMNAKTGAVLAMAAEPRGHDPGDVAQIRMLLTATGGRYANHGSFKRHVIGSVTKPFFAFMALHLMPETSRLKVRASPTNSLFGHRMTSLKPNRWTTRRGDLWVDFKTYIVQSDNIYQNSLGLLLFSGIESLEETPAPWLRQTNGELYIKPGLRRRPLQLGALGNSPNALFIRQDNRFAQAVRVLYGIDTKSGGPLINDRDISIFGKLNDHAIKVLELKEAVEEPRSVLLERSAVCAPEAPRMELGAVASTMEASNILFGANGNRWTDVKLCEVFSRIVTGRKVEARIVYKFLDTLSPSPTEIVLEKEAPAFQDLGIPIEARVFQKLGSALARVPTEGTARVLKSTIMSIRARPGASAFRLVGKTGTIDDIGNSIDSKLFLGAFGLWNAANQEFEGPAFTFVFYLKNAQSKDAHLKLIQKALPRWYDILFAVKDTTH